MKGLVSKGFQINVKRSLVTWRLIFSMMCSALVFAAPAQAQLANKPVTLIVPFAAGGNLDLVARIVAPALTKVLGQTVVVQNKAGAGGAIAASEVARAEPDGSTLLVTTPNAITVVPQMVQTNYDYKSFESVGLISSTSLVVVVNAEKTKFKDLTSLIAYARQNPGKVAIAHSGIGTTNHMGIMQLQQTAGVDFNIVAYKGSGPAILDLLGGQVDVMVDQMSSSLANIQSGKFIALAVLSNERDPLLSNVPGTRELALQALDSSTTTGLLAPAKTPSTIIDQLNRALNQILQDQDVKAQLLKVGSIARTGPPSAFTDLLIREDEQARRLAREGKLQADK
jgi:tripartite-type tricarboxylate transporter receptor subunit TctC